MHLRNGQNMEGTLQAAAPRLIRLTTWNSVDRMRMKDRLSMQLLANDVKRARKCYICGRLPWVDWYGGWCSHDFVLYVRP